MSRKASFAVNSELLTRKTTQRIARARVQTTAGSFAEDPWVSVCHCSDCQVLSGAPMRAIAKAAITDFSLQGAVQTYTKTAQSGQRRDQVFCPVCATPLYGCAAQNPEFVVIRLGCVEERAQLPPQRQIWTASAMPWLADCVAPSGAA
ncbi:GFA family protein [Comamonas sp. MYb21]|uniref:GFA family protein n=1 Tax=Comamonas sp. MYb21 TaxID=1848648 RepID=UPI0030B50568